MIINLNDNFEPYGKGMAFSKFNFPSGCEPHIKLLENVENSIIRITTRIQSMNDFMLLLLATDALRRGGAKDIRVLMPYLPFARQDRVMVSGEPLSIKVFASIMNAQSYSGVIVYDVHSEVSAALLNNFISINNHAFVSEVLRDKSDYLIVCPDHGASKKIFSLCRHLNYFGEIIMCDKRRNVATGEILDITVSHDDLNGKDVFIVDDLCDGGGTYTAIADELKRRNVGKINLIVSHGIFSKGLSVFGSIDHIYTTNSFCDLDIRTTFGANNEKYLHKLTQIKLLNQKQ